MLVTSPYPNVLLADHPLVSHHLSILRNRVTEKKKFNESLSLITGFLGFLSTNELPLMEYPLFTPLKETVGYCIVSRIAIVPIFRAGLRMIPPLEALYPDSIIPTLGMKRDEATAEADIYHEKIPNLTGMKVLLVDPMLATGGSAVKAIKRLIASGAREEDIRLLCILACNPGLEYLQKNCPDVKLICSGIDPELNDIFYILPGLGDAGDRSFGC